MTATPTPAPPLAQQPATAHAPSAATTVADVVVVGAGPAGVSLATALAEAGLRVAGLAPHAPDAPWPNTYGIWEDELAPLGLAHFVTHRWTDCVVYLHGRALRLDRVYTLVDNRRLQAHLLERGAARGVVWRQGPAQAVTHDATGSTVTVGDGATLRGRVVVDATGHRPVFLTARQATGHPIAYQAAYGIVGRFSAPPVRDGQLVLMDFRPDYLTPAERRDQPPTFLYAMDLGDGRYFVEETSLAAAPAVPLTRLEDRLHRRLAHAGVRVVEVEHVEHCLFPMNLPLPRRDGPLLGYGGAASMVHPASGYQVAAALGRARRVADAVAAVVQRPDISPAAIAAAGWEALWPAARLRRHRLYLFGLQAILRFDEEQTHDFFTTFFRLPTTQWAGYLSNTLTTAALVRTMLRIFVTASPRVRSALLANGLGEVGLLWAALRGK